MLAQEYVEQLMAASRNKGQLGSLPPAAVTGVPTKRECKFDDFVVALKKAYYDPSYARYTGDDEPSKGWALAFGLNTTQTTIIVGFKVKLPDGKTFKTVEDIDVFPSDQLIGQLCLVTL